MSKLINKQGTYKQWLLPEKLYHGTSDIYLEDILKNGLMINHEKKNSALSLPYIYLTSSIEMAKGFAQSVAYKKSGNPIIVEIESEKLEADEIGFDVNISLRLCSQCITYNKKIDIKNIIMNVDGILPALMIFNEPEQLKVPVVWNMNEERTIQHLEKIGYKKQSKKEYFIGNENKNKIKR